MLTPQVKRRAIPIEFTSKDRGIRLQKAMASAGVASRRDCEQIIQQGRVTVNGKLVADLPAWIDPEQDAVEVDGTLINPQSAYARQKRKAHTDTNADSHVMLTEGQPTTDSPQLPWSQRTYIMLNKPRRVISTTDDPEGRTHVLDLVNANFQARLFPVGRLDADSSGLILLTDDGELANRLTHPRYNVTKQYRVSIRGKVKDKDLEQLREGLYLAAKHGDTPAKRASMDDIKILSREKDRKRGDRTTLLVTLSEGQNREIRRMLARLGYKVRRLKRVAIGPLVLKGLASGEWRTLRKSEVKQLYKASGLVVR